MSKTNFWNEEHISKQMLDAHLAPSLSAASELMKPLLVVIILKGIFYSIVNNYQTIDSFLFKTLLLIYFNYTPMVCSPKLLDNYSKIS